MLQIETVLDGSEIKIHIQDVAKDGTTKRLSYESEGLRSDLSTTLIGALASDLGEILQRHIARPDTRVTPFLAKLSADAAVTSAAYYQLEADTRAKIEAESVSKAA